MIIDIKKKHTHTHTSPLLQKRKINYLYKKRVNVTTILISIHLSQQLSFEQLKKKKLLKIYPLFYPCTSLNSPHIKKKKENLTPHYHQIVRV